MFCKFTIPNISPSKYLEQLLFPSGVTEIRIQLHLHNFATKSLIDHIASRRFPQNDSCSCHQGNCTYMYPIERKPSRDIKHTYQFLQVHSTVQPFCLVYSTDEFYHQVSHSRSNDHPVVQNTRHLIKFDTARVANSLK